jgi:uncharacterized protein YfaS (alpha-2-macroglobulin family)
MPRFTTTVFRLSCFLLILGWIAAPGQARAEKRLYMVADSPYEIWKGGKTKVQVVVYGPGFYPVSGARILIGDKEVGQTDSDGTLIFNHQPRGHFYLRAEAEIKGEKALGSVPMEAYRRTGSFETRNLFVYTDRGVYRPGEAVLVRSIAWRLRGDFSPIRNAEIETLLRAPSGKVVTGGQMKSDHFGVAATRLRVPEDAPEGAYELVVRHKGAEERARLRVKRFRAPAIRIQHNLPRFVAPQTADLEVVVDLGYFTGGQPESGSFQARALHQGKILFTFQDKIKKGKEHKFRIPLDPIRKVVPDGVRFQVELQATDSFQRSDKVTRDILYAKRPYLAVPDLDKDVYVEGEEVNLTVRLTDPDGIPVRGKTLSLEGDGDKIKLERTTDEGGVVLFKFPMPAHRIQVTVRSADVTDPLFTRWIEYMAKKPMLSTLPNPVVKERRRIPIVVTFDKDFLPVERVVHGDVTDYSGAVTGGFKVRIRKIRGSYQARGSFPAPSWGSMLITLYTAGMRKEDRKRGRRASTVGLLTEGMSLTAHPDKELNIHLDGVPDQARPRTRLNASFRVSTPRKKSTTASLGVMLVDRSVLSLMDPLEKTPMDRFYNPTLKVLSTTGSDILTWPVVTRNWGDNLYDIALPPFGFQEGAPYYQRARRGDGGGSAKGAAGGSAGLMDMAKPKAAKKMKSAPMDDLAMEEAEPPPPPSKAAPVQIMKQKLELRSPRAESQPQVAEKPMRIIIRTDLPETAVWEPQLVAKGGRASLAFTLPEALTEQELIVMASDKKGGIGLVRKVIKVTQPLMVRSDLPRAMTSGDAIQAGVLVRNTTGKALSGEVVLESAGFEVSPASRKVELPAKGSAAVTFKVKAGRPGLVAYTVQVRAGEESDAEKRDLDIRPRGPGERKEFLATLKKGQPFATEIQLEPGEYIEAHLEVAFPTIVPALQEVEKLLDRSAWWADSVLSTPLAACALEAYLARHKPGHPLRKRIRQHLKGVANWLGSQANSDGGYGWWRTGRNSNLFATAQALRLMGKMLEADIAVPPAALQAAFRYLRNRQDKDGLWPVTDIAFWEGSTQKVRMQVGASVFRALAEALPYLKDKSQRNWLSETAGRFEKYLEAPDDPLTAAEAAMGLFAFQKVKGKLPAKARKQLTLAAKRLVELRRRGHWEPSWFHAYGGTIEATVASLELLSTLDPRRFEDELRQGLLYLLSTRGEWGMWHCPFGTATAIRAFTFLPPARKEIPSAVSVRLNGKQIERVGIRPKDPFLSAVRLRHLSLGSHLAPGTNRVEVRYDGNLQAPVNLVVTRWKGKPAKVAASPGLTITRTLARSTVGQGEPVEVNLKVSAKDLREDLLVSIPTPGNGEIDAESLVSLRKVQGVRTARAMPDRLEVVMSGGGELALTYRLLGQRSGSASVEPATVRSSMRAGVCASTGSATLEVQ